MQDVFFSLDCVRRQETLRRTEARWWDTHQRVRRAEEKPLSFSLEGQFCINLNTPAVTDPYIVLIRQTGDAFQSHTQTHTHTPDLGFGGEGQTWEINSTAAKRLSIHLITGKQLPLSLDCCFSRFSAARKHPETWRGEHTEGGRTQSLPILPWQNDHPAMPNVDQERAGERDRERERDENNTGKRNSG